MTSVVRDGITYLYVSSADESGVSSFRVGNDGKLTFIERLIDVDGAAALMGAAGLEVVTSGGNVFLAVASRYESAIQLLRIEANGSLS
jgi:6-phosphogluconolactonase (cycloisomerase 2 family)